jgi:hypothetical protein
VAGSPFHPQRDYGLAGTSEDLREGRRDGERRSEDSEASEVWWSRVWREQGLIERELVQVRGVGSRIEGPVSARGLKMRMIVMMTLGSSSKILRRMDSLHSWRTWGDLCRWTRHGT